MAIWAALPDCAPHLRAEAFAGLFARFLPSIGGGPRDFRKTSRSNIRFVLFSRGGSMAMKSMKKATTTVATCITTVDMTLNTGTLKFRSLADIPLAAVPFGSPISPLRFLAAEAAEGCGTASLTSRRFRSWFWRAQKWKQQFSILDSGRRNGSGKP